MLQYQDVPFQQKTWFDGDADAGLAITLDVTAKEEEEKKNTAGMTRPRTWLLQLWHAVQLQRSAGDIGGISVDTTSQLGKWDQREGSANRDHVRVKREVMWSSESENTCAPTVSHLWPRGCVNKQWQTGKATINDTNVQYGKQQQSFIYSDFTLRLSRHSGDS